MWLEFIKIVFKILKRRIFIEEKRGVVSFFLLFLEEGCEDFKRLEWEDDWVGKGFVNWEFLGVGIE